MTTPTNPTGPTTYPEIVKPADMSIALLWGVFAGYVLPAGASTVQREEMRKAFYAGFTECFKVMTDYSSALPQEEAEQFLSKLAAESEEFYERMKREHSL